MIVATAGHIDHGKSTLVRSLTGIETDRLKEERARGISIELGYAYAPVAGGEVLGIVDVPGHERLVRTMVAGACAIDFALLVIAADDGVMPQTREHLAILELLGVAHGAVALTKADRVGECRLREVLAQVEALIAASPLAGAPVYVLDARRPEDEGTVALRRHLHERAASLAPRCDSKLFRLAVDRVFTLSGHGTIAAGTVFAGEVHPGDTVVVMPTGRTARVRTLHAQNQPAECGRAGQRCALNLVGIGTDEVARGDWLAAPQALAPTTCMDVRLRWLDDAASAHATALHVHLGTAHRMARLVPLGTPGGASAYAQLVFAAPACAAPGDRFIVRNAQATRTLGGGTVLDPYATPRRRRAPERLSRLAALETLAGGGELSELLHHAPEGLEIAELERLCGVAAERLTLPRDSVTVGTSQARFVLHAARWAQLRERALEALREFHAQAPEEPGLDRGRWRRMSAPRLSAALWQALIESLLAAGLIVARGAWLSLPTHTATLSEDDEALARKLKPLIAAGGFDPPWVRDLAAESHEPEQRVREVLRKSVRQGLVHQVVRDLFYDDGCVRRLAAILEQLVQEHGAVHAARFRDAVGLGRKRAIQILEYFDRVGYTRRVKDSHVLRADSSWMR